KPDRPAVQGVGAVVDRKMIRLPVKIELPAGDAVGVATDQRAEIRLVVQVGIESIESQHDVAAEAIPIRRVQLSDPPAISSDLRDHAVAGLEEEQLDRLPVGRFAE